MSLEKKIYIICPVRNQTEEEGRLIRQYKHELELENFNVYYPPDNPNQNIDNIGLRILAEHRNAMSESDECHIYFNRGSMGSVFDLGMAFMAEKPLKLINYDDVLEQAPRYSIESFILKYAYNSSTEFESEFYSRVERIRDKIRKGELIEFKWSRLNSDAVFYLGMAFMSKKPIFLANLQDVKRTPEKSFENVLLELDAQYSKRK